MKNKDIEQLLSHSKNQIADLNAQAKKGQIDSVSVKNTLENMRSALEYIAQDIYIKIKDSVSVKKTPQNVYFPYGKSHNWFKKSVQKNLPDLKQIAPKIYEAIENIQPFRTRDNWLIDLCYLANEAKHNRLSKTEEHKVVTASLPGIGSVHDSSYVSFRNNYINGVKLDDIEIGEPGNVQVTRHSGTAVITTHNKIKFLGKELEVVPFFEKCHRNIFVVLSEIDALL